jgi:hypothetical protein
MALWCLLGWAGLTALHAQETQLNASATVLKRWDLPDSIPMAIWQARYVVVRLALKNNGTESAVLKPDHITLQDPKKKILKPSTSPQVTLDILKTAPYNNSGSTGGIHGQAGMGYPGIYPDGTPPVMAPHPAPEPGAEPGGDAGTVAADRGARLRAALEGARFRATQLEPGQDVTGLLYFKVGKKAPELSGSTLVITLADGKSISVKIP